MKNQIKLLAAIIVAFLLALQAGKVSAELNPKTNKGYDIMDVPNKIFTTTYTFNCSSFHSGYTEFDIEVNGTMIPGFESITEGSPVIVYDNDPVTSHSTVVVNVTSGYMPSSSIFEGPFPAISGTISGSTITFTGVNLTTGGACGLLFY